MPEPKMFTAQEVFEMTWAVLEAIERMKSLFGASETVMPSMAADAVRTMLLAEQSPVGVRVEPGSTKHTFTWRSNAK